MAFSMHSHSGQFCPGHAKDSLEEVIQTAISRGMTIFALTEHMPRLSTTDLYPEEIAAGNSIADHIPNHEAYLQEAIRLREKYAEKLQILIGFEGEWIRSDYVSLIQSLAADPRVDFFIGSVHHVHEIPIDYDKAFFAKARNVAGGTDEKLYEDYFDLQLEMLEALSPRVVGHFDLIRLLASEPDRDLKSMEGVWKKAVRNLEVVVKQGGLLEINSAGLRKGLKEPYPGRSICEEFLKMGGMLTLSDDSHGIEQVGTNFTRATDYIESLGVKELWTLEKKSGLQSSEKGKLGVKPVAVSSVKASFRA